MGNIETVDFQKETISLLQTGKDFNPFLRKDGSWIVDPEIVNCFFREQFKIEFYQVLMHVNQKCRNEFEELLRQTKPKIIGLDIIPDLKQEICPQLQADIQKITAKDFHQTLRKCVDYAKTLCSFDEVIKFAKKRS